MASDLCPGIHVQPNPDPLPGGSIGTIGSRFDPRDSGLDSLPAEDEARRILQVDPLHGDPGRGADLGPQGADLIDDGGGREFQSGGVFPGREPGNLEQ